jgi:steroid 5-alpha reductase family enzyme
VARGRHRYVDVAWGAAFAVAAGASLAMAAGRGEGEALRQGLVTALTVVWGLRLAVHIARRGRGKGEDPRYEKLLAGGSGHPSLRALRKVYLLQALLAWVVSLPVQAAQYLPVGMDALAYAGCAVWLVGLFFEAVGDRQLAAFTADPANRGRIMDRGLWGWTRHPNYFGDFCVWWGLFLFACGDWQTAAATAVSPVLMSLLLTLGSGKRLLERHMADRPGFAAYASRTSGFFPLPPKR